MIYRICIVGQRGVVSQELQKRLRENPQFDVYTMSTQEVLDGCDPPKVDLFVLATLEFSSPQVVDMLPKDARILDISPAFRTKPDWVYGLPELKDQRKRIRDAPRVANPGCFATSAILLLCPLIQSRLYMMNVPLYLDGAGGFSTGGIDLVEKHERGELPVEGAYSMNRMHRHIPEIAHAVDLPCSLWFTPKIIGVPRGIRMQIPVPFLNRDDALNVYRETYRDTEIQVSDETPSKVRVDEWANKRGALIRVYHEPFGAIVVCNLDNLGKGAIDSAEDNIHLMLNIGR